MGSQYGRESRIHLGDYYNSRIYYNSLADRWWHFELDWSGVTEYWTYLENAIDKICWLHIRYGKRGLYGNSMITLSKWKNGVAFNKRGKLCEGGSWGRDDQEPGFVHAKFQMEIKNPSGNMKIKAIVVNLELRITVWTRAMPLESTTHGGHLKPGDWKGPGVRRKQERGAKTESCSLNY